MNQNKKQDLDKLFLELKNKLDNYVLLTKMEA